MAYFPNGSSGEVLDAQCADCPVGKHEEHQCPVRLVQMLYNYDQFDKQGKRTQMSELMDVLVNDNGECQMRKQMLAHIELPLAKCSPLDYLERTAREVE